MSAVQRERVFSDVSVSLIRFEIFYVNLQFVTLDFHEVFLNTVFLMKTNVD